MDKIQILVDVHTRITALRRIERLLEGPTFQMTEKVLEFVNNFDADGLERYLFSTMADDLESLTIRQLRSKAKAYCIPYYSIMNRIQLIKEIHEHRRANEARNAASGSARNTIRSGDNRSITEIPTSGAGISGIHT